MSTCTQAELELLVRDALIERTRDEIDWEVISDSVDVYLGRAEQDQGRVIDRDGIDRDTQATVIAAIILNTTEGVR